MHPLRKRPEDFNGATRVFQVSQNNLPGARSRPARPLIAATQNVLFQN
jgi:hypothetical protein